MVRKATNKAQSQSQRFIAKARELGCDEDEAAFEDRLRKIARAKTPERPKQKRKRAKG